MPNVDLNQVIRSLIREELTAMFGRLSGGPVSVAASNNNTSSASSGTSAASSGPRRRGPPKGSRRVKANEVYGLKPLSKGKAKKGDEVTIVHRGGRAVIATITSADEAGVKVRRLDGVEGIIPKAWDKVYEYNEKVAAEAKKAS